MSWWKFWEKDFWKNKIRQGLLKSARALGLLFGKDNLGQEDVKNILIGADFGVQLSTELSKSVAGKSLNEILAHIKLHLIDLLKKSEEPLFLPKRKEIVLLMGINGSGKTTTCAKLAYNMGRFLGEDEVRVLVVAADTFRAAAVAQLEEWAAKYKLHIVSDRLVKDPAAMVYRALDVAKAENYEKIIIDTAGRLHTREDLRAQLTKMAKIIDKFNAKGEYVLRVVMVVDACVGQNLLSQVAMFREAIGIDGLIVNKLDGTSKAGVVANLVKEQGLKIYFLGMGEQIEDVVGFEAEFFVNTIFDKIK